MRRVVFNKCGKSQGQLGCPPEGGAHLAGHDAVALETDIPADHMNAGLDAMLRDVKWLKQKKHSQDSGKISSRPAPRQLGIPPWWFSLVWESPQKNPRTHQV